MLFPRSYLVEVFLAQIEWTRGDREQQQNQSSVLLVKTSSTALSQRSLMEEKDSAKPHGFALYLHFEECVLWFLNSPPRTGPWFSKTWRFGWESPEQPQRDTVHYRPPAQLQNSGKPELHTGERKFILQHVLPWPTLLSTAYWQ